MQFWMLELLVWRQYGKSSRRYLDHTWRDLIDIRRIASTQYRKQEVPSISEASNTLCACNTPMHYPYPYSQRRIHCNRFNVLQVPEHTSSAVFHGIDPIHFSLGMYLIDLDTLERITSLEACSTKFGVRMDVITTGDALGSFLDHEYYWVWFNSRDHLPVLL